MMPRCVIVITMWLGAVGCAYNPPPAAPTTPKSSAIGLKIDYSDPLIALDGIDSVRLIKVDGRLGEASFFHIVQSGFRSRGNYFYTVNVEPGRYVLAWLTHERLIGQLLFWGYSTVHYFLDEGSSALTAIEIGEGEVKFMGLISVDFDNFTDRWGDADPLRERLRRIATQDERDRWGFDLYHYNTAQTWRVRRDPEFETAFLNDAIDELEGTGWDKIAQRQLDALNVQGASAIPGN